MKKNISLTPRLLTVASLVRGEFVADVGTDHGFLPIYLAETGKISRAVASDIRPEPLARARKNIAEHALSEKIDAVLTNGLSGLEKHPFTDIIIAGMGGMTAADIISRAEFLRERRTHLILQPMQNAPKLCEYLAENGFAVDNEKLVFDDGHIYRIISATYDGIRRTLSPLQALLGAYNIAHKGDRAAEFASLCEKNESLLAAKIKGLAAAGADNSAERELLALIKKEKTEVRTIWQA